VSAEDIDKKDLDKRVRRLTTLTKDDEILVLAADFFDSEHPFPTVRALFIHHLLIYSSSCILSLLCLQFFSLLLRRVTNPLFLVLLFQREDLFKLILSLLRLKPPKLRKASQDRDDAEDSLEGASSTTSPPPAHSEEPSLDKKRKRVEELFSLSTLIRLKHIYNF
jgi:hypothetical protein